MTQLKNLILFFIFTLVTFSVSIISYSGYHINIADIPDGQKFTAIDIKALEDSDKSPFVISIDRGNGYKNRSTYLVRYKKTEEHNAEKGLELESLYWSNIIYGGLDGTIIFDSENGEMYKLSDKLNAQTLTKI